MSGRVDHLIIRADAGRIPLPDRSVQLTMGSPPYSDVRLYLEDGSDLGIARDPSAWIDWMLAVTAEALRVTDGPVLWVAAGPTRDRNYQPLCEGLAYHWWQAGGSMYRPCYWHRQGIAGSGGDQWFRQDVEYVLCFKRPGPLPWADPTATGHPPKWAPGGEMSHRLSDGARVNQWGGRATSGRGKRANGTEQEPGRPSHRYELAISNGRMKLPSGEQRMGGEVQDYIPPDLANPGTLIRTLTGGGNLGHLLAHHNEAPYPTDLADHFIRSLCPPGGIVLDPFGGSGSTAEAALKCGRHAISGDLRISQCRLAQRRLEHPHAPVPRSSAARDVPLPLFDRLDGSDI